MSDLNSNPDQNSITNGNEPNSHASLLTTDDLNQNSKNSKSVVCQFCDSKVLTPDVATLKQLKDHFLPAMRQKRSFATNGGTEGPEGDHLDKFWMVEDMYHFENVGFSKAVNNVKYLICADCEMGPIGFHDPSSPKEFYVALSRVDHK